MSDRRGPSRGTFWTLYRELKAGRVTRREFVARASALGIGLPVTLFVLNAVKVDSVSAAPPAQEPGFLSTRPTEGTDGQRRGAGGELKILLSRAPRRALAEALITEPLMSYAQDGTLLPTLVSEVPSVENGGVSADLTTVTYKLLPDVTWSDGQPFTAADVVFTWQWIVDESNESVYTDFYHPIERVEAVEPQTVKVAFKNPTLAWYVPFTGSYAGGIYPKHFWDGKDPIAANDEFRRAPIGTGPYVVESFTENDQVTYKVNDTYREPNKPFFATVKLKGGADATSTARAVLQTGDWDLAWNVEFVETDILREMEMAGKGTVVAQPGTYVERVVINFADPNREVNGERAQKDTPHPFLTDKAVRQALSLATDRLTIATEIWPGEPPAQNILTGIPRYESPNTAYGFNLDRANQVLDEAGWVRNGGVRRKDDVALKLTYVSPVYDARQKTQALNKSTWEKAGFEVVLGQMDTGIYFDDAAGNDQNANHFYRDLQMYTAGLGSPYPLSYMQYWYAGPDGQNIAQKSNGWSGANEARYANAEYDALWEQAAKETDPEKAAQLFVQMNDIVVDDVVVIPLVQRPAEKYAVLNTLRAGNISPNFWEILVWNIANWNRVG